MQRKYSYFEYKKALLHYAEYGNHDRVLICFHGFGQTNEHFKMLEEALRDKYRIFSFDLFYHGKSFWHQRDRPLTKEFLQELITQFLDEKKIERFSVLGFSMGGKLALALLELFPQRIDKIILIAPDGIKTSFWYSLATYPGWMRKIFRSVVINPGLYFKLVRSLRFFRLVDNGILRFANTQMKSRSQRRRVYYSWIIFKELKFDMKHIAGLLNRYHIHVEMFLGEYDKIITVPNMEILLSRLSNYSMQVLPVGHNHLIEAVADFYRRR